MDEAELTRYADRGLRETMAAVLRRARDAENRVEGAVQAERKRIVGFLREFDPILAHAIDILEHHKE